MSICDIKRWRLYNDTDNIDDGYLKKIISFCRIKEVTKFIVYVSPSDDSFFEGWAHGDIEGVHPHYIELFLGDKRTRNIKYAFGGSDTLSFDEGLIFMVAHEMRHLWQYAKLETRYFGFSKKEIEVDADRYAHGILQKWKNGAGFRYAFYG